MSLKTSCRYSLYNTSSIHFSYDMHFLFLHLKMTEKFCLKWNDFQSNVTSAFSLFRTKTNFQDVTLVSDDQKQISAHRVVLAASSEYFNNILSQNSHSHPLLCLDGIKFHELNNVLDYIYNGEVNVYQEDLERFLQIAQKLQLQGLLSTEEHEQEEKIEVIDKPTIFEAGIIESVNKHLTGQTKEKKIVTMNSKDFQTIEELDVYIEQQIVKTDGVYKCNICNRTSNRISNIKEHIELHIDGLSFECSFCGKTMSSRHCLRNHK